MSIRKLTVQSNIYGPTVGLIGAVVDTEEGAHSLGVVWAFPNLRALVVNPENSLESLEELVGSTACRSAVQYWGRQRVGTSTPYASMGPLTLPSSNQPYSKS
ncbi:hypothetical protein FRB98_008035 [Tulasnella sp. 332]|nr:hypothetical protein FRB98_008035 [Tulasnella sp. 332]